MTQLLNRTVGVLVSWVGPAVVGTPRAIEEDVL